MELALNQLKKLLNVDESKISIPPNPEMGDYATNIAFSKAKETGDNPNIAAIKIISKLDLSKTLFSKVKAYGPYINFFLDKEKVINTILRDVLKSKEKYGNLKKSKDVFITEFPSPNTNKPLHIGHLFQMLLGTSISRVLETQGFIVKRTNLYNDRGIHICKSMLAYEKWGKGKKPKSRPDFFVGDYYVLFDKKKNSKLELEVQEMLKKWEEGDKKILSLWKKMNSWCYKGHNQTFKRVGLDKYDKIYYESDFYNQGKDIVKDAVKKGLFVEEEDGSVYVNLGNLGKKYVIRKGGTSIYITQDLALIKLKYNDFKFKKCLYMTGSEQNFYFKQLFKIFEILGYKFASNCYHIGTGMVRLPSGKIKSREGIVVDTEDLLDDMKKLAKTEMKKRGSKVNDNISESIGLAAVKYHFLKTSSHKDIIFNPEESLSFEGNTGPYLLYSLVRAYKILNKTKVKIDANVKPSLNNTIEEFKLIKDFADFNNILSKTAESFSPHTLANYAHNLASDFNSFYEKVPVLKSETPNLIKARLRIVKAYKIIMEKCLYLLGIQPVKEM